MSAWLSVIVAAGLDLTYPGVEREAREVRPLCLSRDLDPIVSGSFDVGPTWTWYNSNLGLKDSPGISFSIFAAFDDPAGPRHEKRVRVTGEEGSSGGWLEWGMKFELRYAWSEYEPTGRRTGVGCVNIGYFVNYWLSDQFSVGTSATVGEALLARTVGPGPREERKGQNYVLALPRLGAYLGSGFTVSFEPEWTLLRTGFNDDHYRNTTNLTVTLSVAFRF